MKSSIFKTGDTSSFAKSSRSMSKFLSVGAGTLAIVHFLFIYFYFQSSTIISTLSLFLPVLFLASFLCSFTKLSNKKLYEIILGVFISVSLVMLYIAYLFNFNSEYIILMLAVFGVILVAIPTTKQLLIYFLLVFLSLEVFLFLSDISIGFTLLVSLSFGAVFTLTCMISAQKKGLSYHSTQNAKILKTLVNNTNDSMFLVDFFSNEIQDYNQKTNEIFGLINADDFLAKQYSHLFTEEGFIEARRKKINEKMEEEGYYQTDAMFRRKDGTNFLGRLHLSPFEALDKKYYLLQIKNIAVRKL
jgi:PAS domain S-box-containing protein